MIETNVAFSRETSNFMSNTSTCRPGSPRTRILLEVLTLVRICLSHDRGILRFAYGFTLDCKIIQQFWFCYLIVLFDILLDVITCVSPSLTPILSSWDPDLTLDGSLVIMLHHWSGYSRRGTKVFLGAHNYSIDPLFSLTL